MADSPSRVHTRIDGPIGWVVFDNPGRHNAMSVSMWEALPGAVDALEADPAVRVIVLRGAGDAAFVSGADISQFDRVRDSVEANERYEAIGDAGMGRLAACTKPTSRSRCSATCVSQTNRCGSASRRRGWGWATAGAASRSWSTPWALRTRARSSSPRAATARRTRCAWAS
jgi:hypothetical protein